MIPSGLKSKRAPRGSRQLVNFKVNMNDINVELTKFYRLLSTDLVKELRPHEKRLAAQVRSRFDEKWSDTKSGRIRAVSSAIKGHTFKSGTLRGKSFSVSIGIGNVSDLDKKTQLSRLDAKFPQYHETPFLPKSARVKKLSGQPSRQINYLWRILEDRNSSIAAPYGPVTKSVMSFTSQKEGYTQFLHAKIVTDWELSGTYFNRRWFFLNDQRRIWSRDRRILEKTFRALVRLQLRKTRFSFANYSLSDRA